MSRMIQRHFLVIISLIPGILCGAIPDFDEALIHKLPPSVAEWHSREGMAFCVKTEQAGLSWAQAHELFTGERLRAAQVSPTRLLIFSGDRQAGSIQRIERNDIGVLQLKILTDPVNGSFFSVRVIRFPVFCW